MFVYTSLPSELKYGNPKLMSCKKLLFLFCFISGCLSESNAQELTLTGTYTGALYQKFQSKALMFTMVLNIVNIKGQSFTGTVKNVSNDGNNYYVVYNIQGSVEDNVIEWNDVSVAEERSGSEINWCKQLIAGKIKITDDSIVLSGDWKNDGTMLFYKKTLLLDGGGCYPGSFRVAKKNDTKSLSSKNKDSIVPKIQSKKTSDSTFLTRKVDIKEKFEVVSDSIKLFFYDNGIIDNDTISVYYNNVLLLNHQRLSYTPIIATIPIVKNGRNELQMFANNEGEIPPNTALLVFYDNRIRREITLKSDLKTTAALIFTKK